MKRMQHEKIWIKRENCQVISPLAVGFDPIPAFSDNYWMIMTLKTIVFKVRAFMLFPTLSITPLTNHTAIHREEGVLG